MYLINKLLVCKHIGDRTTKSEDSDGTMVTSEGGIVPNAFTKNCF